MTTELHKMVATYWDIQHMRILVDNRHKVSEDNQFREVNEAINRLKESEETITANIKNEVVKYPIHKWIISQKGLSFVMAAQLVGVIEDISRFDNVSKLWAYFGLAPVDYCKICGKRYYPLEQKADKILNISKRLKEQHDKKIVKEKKAKNDFEESAKNMLCSCDNPVLERKSNKKKEGYLLDYNPKAKSLALGKIVTQLLMAKHPIYKEIYDSEKSRLAMRDDLIQEMSEKKGKVTKNGVSKGTGHIDRMAKRKMVKIFLQNLWVHWRELENLPVSKPYVIDRMGHSDYIQP